MGMAKSMKQGMEVGHSLPNIELINWNKETKKLYELPGKTVLFFTSVHCAFCIDLLPHLMEIQNCYSASYVLFSTGDEMDHREMVDYFNWDFPVIAMKQNEMEEAFLIKHMPYVIFADEFHKVTGGGVIYNFEDFKQYLLNNHEDDKESMDL